MFRHNYRLSIVIAPGYRASKGLAFLVSTRLSIAQISVVSAVIRSHIISSNHFVVALYERLPYMQWICVISFFNSFGKAFAYTMIDHPISVRT